MDCAVDQYMDYAIFTLLQSKFPNFDAIFAPES